MRKGPGDERLRREVHDDLGPGDPVGPRDRVEVTHVDAQRLDVLAEPGEREQARRSRLAARCARDARAERQQPQRQPRALEAGVPGHEHAPAGPEAGVEHAGYCRTRAGTPATVSPGATSRVTTAPAPTSARAPIRTPPRMTAPEPMLAPRSTVVSSTSQSSPLCSSPVSFVARGALSLMNITPCPTKTSSSMRTPSQTKVWLEILQRAPTDAPRWISTKVPTRLPSPMRHP